MSETKIGYKDILKQKEYMKMILAALINRFGDSIDAIASTWLVYEITGNAAWSAIIFGINKLPTVFITPLAGAWVEGGNKKSIMVVTDLIRAVCVFCVATCYLLGFLQPWILVLTNFTISTAEAFRGPASTALTPKILAKEYLETFTDGLKYVKTDKVICFFMGITLFMNAVLVPFNSLQAPLVSEIFSGGAEVLSVMSISATVSMLLGSVIYPKLDGKMSGKTLFLICGVGMGVYYASVILCQPLYVNKIFMYAFAALATGILGFCAAMCCSFLNVEFVRRVDEKYLARTDAISMSLAMAALPVVSFVISALVAYVSTATFFVAAGVVDIIVCIFIVRSHVLDDEKEVETLEEQESIAM